MLHLDSFTVVDFRRLDGIRADHCVSIYLPTHAVSRETEQDKILFKNLCNSAIVQLESAGADKRRVLAIQGQIKPIFDDLQFWNHLSGGLAIFITPESIESFRLPRVVTQEVEVSDRFHIKPLIPLLAFPQTAYVLELSENRVKLWEVTESDIHEVEVLGMPASFDAAMKKRTGQPTADAESVSMRQAEQKKIRQRQFVRDVEEALRPFLLGQRVPLVLAGVDTLLVYYQEANTYAHMTATTISGNQEHRRRDHFAADARAIAAGRFEADIRSLLDQVEALHHERLSSTDIDEIARAASEGRVESLIVDVERELYGRLSRSAAALPGAEASATTYDILDELVGVTVRQGGDVIGLRQSEMPDGVKAAAIFRYAG
jgi:hypothetical protein